MQIPHSWTCSASWSWSLSCGSEQSWESTVSGTGGMHWQCCTLTVEWCSLWGWRAILRAENGFICPGSVPEKAFSTFRPMSGQAPIPNRRLKLLYCFNGNFFSYWKIGGESNQTNKQQQQKANLSVLSSSDAFWFILWSVTCHLAFTC